MPFRTADDLSVIIPGWTERGAFKEKRKKIVGTLDIF